MIAVSCTTFVDLTWRERHIERWIRFGRKSCEQILDPQRRIVGFAPDGIFAFVRWAANEHGTIVSRIDILRAAFPGEPYQTLPFVRPGGEILAKAETWPTVERVLQHIDAIERQGLDPVDVDPDHWRHVHNRLRVGEPPSSYGLARHRAWLLRRSVRP